ncbi:unnamed protein product [Echinostoma caproni]|uniref:ANK_REP_REGION domain-containing protein n=1 Tax=Echinostoma caproni TaxID=27848 RepID=A0A183AIG6_9TREM|nr:unnamed protein product [Echinostoma caproni]
MYPRYGSGTLPWGQAPPTAGFEQPRIDDGLIEVIGLSATTLVGGHGDRICQCRTVTLTTNKVIPMQMDGEPCRLMPATLNIRCSYQALVVQKQGHQPTQTTRGPDRSFLISGGDQARLLIFVISLNDYEAIPDDAIALRQAALFYGAVSVRFNADLGVVRAAIEVFNRSVQADQPEPPNTESSSFGCDSVPFCLSKSWAFIDSTTAATRFFRIDQKKESSHFITDICNMEELFLIDPSLPARILFENETETNGDGVSNERTCEYSSINYQIKTIESKTEECSSVSAHEAPIMGSSSGVPLVRSELPKSEHLIEHDERAYDSEDQPNPVPPGETESRTMNMDQRPDTLSETSTDQVSAPTKHSNGLSKSSEDNEKGSADEVTDRSKERVSKWLQLNGSRWRSISSSASERTSENQQLASSDEQTETFEKSRSIMHRPYWVKQVNKEDSLQARLDKALLHASRKGLVNQIDALLEAGANILAVDERGRSCLHLATKFGYEKAVRTLLKYASPELLELREYEKKQTALHKAAVYRRRNICQLLLKAGACPTARDAHGKRPRRLAYDVDDYSLAHYLQHSLFELEHGLPVAFIHTPVPPPYPLFSSH